MLRSVQLAADEYLDIDLSVFDFEKQEADRNVGFMSGKY